MGLMTPRLTAVAAVARREAELHGIASPRLAHVVWAALWMGETKAAAILEPAVNRDELEAAMAQPGHGTAADDVYVHASRIAEHLGHEHVGVEHVVFAVAEEAPTWLKDPERVSADLAAAIGVPRRPTDEPT
jgi:Clp amino terminal domain, pathogenicity island component